MTKYIDAELLRKKIEKWKSLFSKEKEKKDASKTDKLSLGGRIAMLEEILVLIDSLQQEQPCNRAIYLDIMFSNMKRKRSLKQLEYLNKVYREQSCDTCTNDKGCVTCKDGELWEGKEQSCEDLEEEIAVAIYKIDGTGKTHLVKEEELYDFARHFYELGKGGK